MSTSETRPTGSHLSREKVPERQPRAKGEGTFETAEDVSAFTAARDNPA